MLTRKLGMNAGLCKSFECRDYSLGMPSARLIDHCVPHGRCHAVKLIVNCFSILSLRELLSECTMIPFHVFLIFLSRPSFTDDHEKPVALWVRTPPEIESISSKRRRSPLLSKIRRLPVVAGRIEVGVVTERRYCRASPI